VETALRRMVWLRRKGKVSSPAGFLVVASRVEWRVQHNTADIVAARRTEVNRPEDTIAKDRQN
jgi:hypothetical protein